MNTFRDIKETLTAKLTGQKYHNNLLGESLQDQLRKATSKALFEPDEEINAQARAGWEKEGRVHLPRGRRSGVVMTARDWEMDG